MACAYDDGEVSDAVEELRKTVDEFIALKAINGWCGLCKAPASTWFYEEAAMKFRTMEEARPALAACEQAQRRTAKFLRAGKN